jgi:preprotein translocase subunit SecA
MWELGAEALSVEIADAVADRIAGVRDELGAPVFDAIEKVTFVQTADEAWQAHLQVLDGMTAAMVLSPWGHRSAVADFSARCREAYAGFREGIVDEFVPRLLDAVEQDSDEADPPATQSVLSELQAILE